MISSRDNAKLKLVRKLATRRQRDKFGLFAAEGEDLVAAALEGGWELDFALVDAARPPELPLRAELRELLEEAGREGPLGWISTRAVEELEEDRTDSYELEVGLWPGGKRRLLLRCDFHGNWIRWRS